MQIKTKDENRLNKGSNDLQTNLIKLLDVLDKSDEVEILRNKVRNCNDLIELVELTNQTLKIINEK